MDEKPRTAIRIYESESGPVELRLDGERQTLLVTQAEMVNIFGVDRSVISRHISNIFASGELDEESNLQKMQFPSSDKPTTTYSLDVVISVGYRVNSVKATKFRQWATGVLRDYLETGYALNPARLAESPEDLRELARRIREVRMSEIAAYAKVREIFKEFASDYDRTSDAARRFYAMTQDKFEYAVTGKTAAQIVLDRASATKPKMGLMTVAGEIPTAAEVKIGKNYMTEDELHFLGNISEQWMLFCESAAMRGKKLTMEELATRLNMLLMANDYPVLYEYGGKYERGQADSHALAQLKMYKQLQAPRKPKRLKSEN